MAEQTDRAVHFLEGLLDAFGLEATFDHVEDGDDVEVRVHGDDLGILIGPRGQTLSSIQDLTPLAAQREAGRDGLTYANPTGLELTHSRPSISRSRRTASVARSCWTRLLRRASPIRPSASSPGCFSSRRNAAVR